MDILPDAWIYREALMIKNTHDGVEYLTFENIGRIPGIRQAFSTRIGGVSRGIYSSMNLGYTRGDVRENVDENFRRMAGVLGCSLGDLVTGVQTHTVNVRLVTADDAGKGVTRPTGYNDVDGLITAQPGLVDLLCIVDCVWHSVCPSLLRRSGQQGNRPVPLGLARHRKQDGPGNHKGNA